MQMTEVGDLYKQWILATGRKLREGDTPPRGPEDVRRRREVIRARMRAAEGDALLPPEQACPLNPEVLGVLERDGYRVERLLFQTRPGCYVTANTYVPSGRTGRMPAVLCVHGHWAGARRDPVVQSRCIGLAKLGFVALTLDAWGAGERGTRVSQNEYHGGLLGASLWPVGTPLHGLQLYDNVRALDYLQSRPDVDPDRLGCTGASGGGNQTTYLTAFEDRIRCGVPVCSVGTFQNYLDAACCVDEVLRGALTFAEEGDLLGIAAPRAVMVITATQDVYHFGPKSSGEVVERARAYFQAVGHEERLRHVLVESGHAYSQPMREAMYGWMQRWLMDQGDGSPTPEPPLSPEDPEAIRCFTPPFRSGKVMTTVQWVREKTEALARETAPGPGTEWGKDRADRLRRLADALALPESPEAPPYPLESVSEFRKASRAEAPLVLLCHPQGHAAALASPLARLLGEKDLAVGALTLRGCGVLTLPNQGLGEAIPDHNLVEWSLWINRPLLGQWVNDLRRVLRAPWSGAQPRRVVLVGWREAGLAALLAAALEPACAGVAAIESLASFRGEGVPHNQRMVVFQPDLLKIGDVPHLAALCAPRPVLIERPNRLDGAPATETDLEAWHRPTRSVYRSLKANERLRVGSMGSDAAVADLIRSWCR